jgi:hypothetical protein
LDSWKSDIQVATRCDLVYRDCWIEIKGAWTFKGIKSDPFTGLEKNGSFRPHLLTKQNCALNDVLVRLPNLYGQPDVTTVGFILVFVECKEFPDDGNLVAEFIRRAGLDKSPWKCC